MLTDKGITPLQPPTPKQQTRASRFNTHQALILRLSSPCMLLGAAAIWYNKYLKSATHKHFQSWHAIFGIGAVGWMVMQGLMGVGIAWYGKELFGSEGAAKKMYKYHRYVPAPRSSYLRECMACSSRPTRE